MSDPNPTRPLSEIGHLFLSSVREKQIGNAPRPVRVPPQAQARAAGTPAVGPSDELTPEELAEVGAEPAAAAPGERPQHAGIPVTALIVQHLNGKAPQRVREYARHLAANGQRVGVIQADGSEVVLMRFERSIEPNEGDPQPADVMEHFDSRLVTEAMEEMSFDLDRWLIVLPNTRCNESRSLLKEIDHWVVLSTCDHDGVVSCYRSLKGLAEIHQPRLTLSLLDTASPVVAERVFQKLNNVCLQFLGIELRNEGMVRPTRAVAETVVVHCRVSHDKGQLAAGAQWLALSAFIAKLKVQQAMSAIAGEKLDGSPSPAQGSASSAIDPETPEELQELSSDQPEPAMNLRPQPESRAQDGLPPVPPPMVMRASFTDSELAPQPPAELDEVIDLPGDTASEDAIISAVLGHARGQMIECPVRPPTCPQARLAVTRDRGLVVIAVAQKGLKELRAIAQAYRWAAENRSLIAMALPQLAIDPHRHPQLTLLVDHADAAADSLATMLQSGTVTIRSYRKLKWGARTGLLLEAA